MEIQQNEPPREFIVGRSQPIAIRDCGRVRLAPNEQVTFVTDGDAEYDVTRKGWGFYATPSTNGRLAQFGFRSAVVRNPEGRAYVLLVQENKMTEFNEYIETESMDVLIWLDDAKSLDALSRQTRSEEPHVDC